MYSWFMKGFLRDVCGMYAGCIRDVYGMYTGCVCRGWGTGHGGLCVCEDLANRFDPIGQDIIHDTLSYQNRNKGSALPGWLEFPNKYTYIFRLKMLYRCNLQYTVSAHLERTQSN